MKIWDLKHTTFTVGDFVSWMAAKELELSPSFQRRPVWRPAAKSLFIDTIVRGLPVPIIFLRERTDVESLRTVREVVDGQQRLRAVLAFLRPDLIPDFKEENDDFTVLKTHNDEIAGLRYEQLSRAVKARILGYQFSIDVLPSDTADADVLKIFARMNATGLKLNEQELRNAAWHGEFHSSVYETSLEQLDRWRDWGIFTEYNIARMLEAELMSELYILALSGIAGKSARNIEKYYKERDEKFLEKVEIEKRISFLFDEIDENIGNRIRNTQYNKRTLFYSLFAVLYDIAYGLGSPLKRIKPKPFSSAVWKGLLTASKKIAGQNAPQRVLESAARRTTHKSSRESLTRFLVKEIANATTER